MTLIQSDFQVKNDEQTNLTPHILLKNPVKIRHFYNREQNIF